MFFRIVSVKEVETHSLETDIWIIVNRKVYDVTKFAPIHPGGAQIIYQHAGKDASVKYNNIYSSSLIATELYGSCISELDTSTVPPSWLTSAPRKPPLSDALSLKDFEKAFNSSAANDNLTRDANQTMLQRIWLRPAIIRDISTVPVYIAPVGAAKNICREDKLLLARAVYKAGNMQYIATTAFHSLAEILNTTPEQAWLQIRQATASGKIKRFLITADLPVMSKQEADERLKPEKGRGLVSNSSFINPTLNWQDILWLRRITGLLLLIKGIQQAEDTHLTLYYSLDGIVVSNHGGHTADTTPLSILTLLEIRRNCPEAFERIVVLVDEGFRRGSDIIKAVYLEASAVGLDRLFIYALTYGKPGVLHAIENR
ncbi:FMN-dependent alpha-hydroxy acid dehydrogenase family protein [Aspergillus brunneoviolaceus CBS 621.78]|uniref:FMN-linked oxidoreductase n=1 Tax=Aspergillus brunneoviolaceus CBS 621.78 TaxID=1450534 RepID=A0ACD1GE88_9EURO|nr:FMN-linked oxidoreductase [Aspergillus brunneoviolaceus CBS 621.78]RAH47497.1 FMN-linked oxidoreductase [Aspergillus brunneoviolaceus CBS 621.78]